MVIAQESKTERLHASVTPTEKRSVELVATVEGATVSELLRRESIDALVERGQKIAERLRDLNAA